MILRHRLINPYEARMQSKHSVSVSPFIIAFIFLMCGVIAMVICDFIENKNLVTEEKEVIYKGYMIKSSGEQRPIVEIDGNEYISKYEQDVRDTSYVGNIVTIEYDVDDMNSFRVVKWGSNNE